MDGRGLFEVFLSYFSKGPCCFPYVLLIAGCMIALETVYDLALHLLWILVLRLHEYLFYGFVAFEVNLYAILTTDVLDTFHNSFSIWYDYLSHC